MRFTEAKKGKSWVLIVAIVVIGGIVALTFCDFNPTPKTVQKNIVFEAD